MKQYIEMMLQYAVARACSFQMFLVSVFNLITPNLIGKFNATYYGQDKRQQFMHSYDLYPS